MSQLKRKRCETRNEKLETSDKKRNRGQATQKKRKKLRNSVRVTVIVTGTVSVKVEEIVRAGGKIRARASTSAWESVKVKKIKRVRGKVTVCSRVRVKIII